jgi:hypothetical protein
MTTKKYILKPGRHQFAPGSAATHHNNNLSDEEAEWYLAKYPHIASLFDAITEDPDPACRVSREESFELMGKIETIKSVESPSPICEITKQIT